jgi:hypothetical protein
MIDLLQTQMGKTAMVNTDNQQNIFGTFAQ